MADSKLISKEEVKSKVIDFTLGLYDIHDIPRNAVQSIIENVQSLVGETLVPFIKQEVGAEIKNECSDRVCGAVNLIFDENCLPFQGLQTEYLRFQKYKKEKSFVEPEKVQIGFERVFVIVNYNEIKVDLIPRYMAYVPMKESIKNLLQKPKIYEKISEYIQKLAEEKEEISNVMQGLLWRKKYGNRKDTLPIFLFIDEFETGNALGSHSGEQKMTGIFLSLPFLPPELVEKLENILLVGIYLAKYSYIFDKQNIFQRITDNLNDLIENGIEIKTESGTVKLYLQLFLVTGDNAGLNFFCGFMSSFKALRFCRICLATSSECKTMCEVDLTLLRNKLNYDRNVRNNFFASGVKENCIFNFVKNFHICINKTVDLHHDWAQGILPYSVGKILTHFIEVEKIFDIGFLNDAIKTYKFPEWETNKPRPMKMEYPKKSEKLDGAKKKLKFKQSAAEALCLCRHLGLIIGHLIPAGNRYWKLYLIARQIQDIITAPKYTISDLYFLRDLIRQHNSLYIELFGDLKPKMHFALHICENLLLNGPAVHFWAMPFERKNKQMKELGSSSKSHINLPWTIAYRNQLHMCSTQNKISLDSNIKVGTIDNEFDTDIRRVLKNVQCAKSYKYLEIDGRKYSPGTILVSEIDVNKGPILNQIFKIFQVRDNFYFLLKKVEIDYFDPNYYANKVTISNKLEKFIHIDRLLIKCPCSLHQKHQSDYVVMKHQL